MRTAYTGSPQALHVNQRCPGQIWVARASDSAAAVHSQARIEALGPSSRSDLAALLAALNDAEARHYPSAHPLAQRHVDALDRPNLRLAVVRDARQRALGLAGLQLFDESAELSSWVVTPSQRGQGLGAALLAELEREALRQRQPLLRVQVAASQRGAQRLLERSGYGRCGPFSGRRAEPFSLFFEKLLGL
ncbi:GNAT family N-acetyltransferase [Paucibacter sp. Y2R2-4]|uniref:GNAT family N-acetyltransferase n=1 Tax=Paucibacter sp. Y2R2-4 TaxID=2893553 RepID=UPI0021E3E846|nr:GNAT family N-acetyltransferase [Paucibacter sp. Y2R2-4]MCV2350739.1 GNAT family N-acetyltransferase [Paucibacter sp. Y2R2-4]